MMKRFLDLCVALVLLLSLCGCSASLPEDNKQLSAEQSYDERLNNCKKQIEAVTDFKPEIVIVLGSGLGDYADSLDIITTIPYKDIEGWPKSTAPNHAGNLIFAEYNGLKLAVMQGRIHYYEGYTPEEVVLPLRVLHMLGADKVILTNAVGSINPDFKVGEFVCVNDQISSFVPSPLIGKNNDELGERFTGMTDAFDPDMREAVLKAGKDNGIPVHTGVYVQTTGPQYETPAEIRMYRTLGADTVGMSTAMEVIAARHMNMRVCAINCISNMAAGVEEEFSHDTVAENMKNSADDLKILIGGLLDHLNK